MQNDSQDIGLHGLYPARIKNQTFVLEMQSLIDQMASCWSVARYMSAHLYAGGIASGTKDNIRHLEQGGLQLKPFPLL